MAQNILIAALGEHPAVITGMVKALQDKEGIKIDTVHVLHTTDTGKYIGREGVKHIAQFLENDCEVRSEPLPYSDPNSHQTSKNFLQTVAEILGKYRNPETYWVYLSLAGGRKNMSALMALTTQFFPSIKGIYHLLDKAEDSANPTWPSIEEMELSMTEDEVGRVLDPPLDNLELISIPYPGVLGNADTLWDLLRTGETLSVYPAEFLNFYKDKRNQEEKEEATLNIYVSEQTILDYQGIGAELQKKLIGYARRMISPSHLNSKAHGASGWITDCEVYPEHKAHSALRLFYYWDRPQNEITICRAMHHSEYDRKGELWYKTFPKANPISVLEQEQILLVPLGKSPMVATQIYTLLQESEDRGCPRISAVAVLYPERHLVIGNGVRLLETQFKRKKVEFIKYPIKGLTDINSTKACEFYKDELLAVINKLGQKYPDRPIVLALSGGRKGMSVLTLFAAQYAGIEHVYHTLITDIELEKRVEEETSLKALDKLASDNDKAKRLFLEVYDRSKFELFTIPVIPLK